MGLQLLLEMGLLLHHCAKTKSIRRGLCLHAAAIKTGTQQDIYTSNHILNMYAKCGKIKSADKVFDEMSERNLITWSAMISGYDQASHPHLALTLYSKMLSEYDHIKPTEFIFASVLSSCARLLALPTGLQIHAQTIKLGYDSVSFVTNSLISMYMKCGKCSDALLIFEGGDNPTCVSYNAVITGLVENEKSDKGFEIFKLMCQVGLVPDRFTFVGLLEACSTMNNPRRGMALHCQTIKLNLDMTAFVGNVIITMYAKLSLMVEAEKVFRLIEERDVISWNTFIAACSNFDHHAKALSVFREMRETSVRTDDFTYASILSACAGVASIRLGKEIHAYLIRRRPNSDVGVNNALVNMYAKCGCIWHAYTVYNQMQHHNLVSWNSIIAGFANHGFGGKALELFKQMKDTGLKPDSVTFLELLTACNHAGLVDQGKEYFNSMTDYGTSPDIEHFSCLIDMLGRAGRLNEAESFMQKYVFGNDPVVLGCLLSASRLHGDVVVGERVARRLLKLQPHVSTSPYVLLSNLFASDGMWDGVAEARKMLKGSGLKKEPGHSLIEVKGLVEKFTIGDFSHSKIEEIVCILRILSWKGDWEEFLCN